MGGAQNYYCLLENHNVISKVLYFKISGHGPIRL